MAHHHFTHADRKEISILLKRGYSHRDIAGEMLCDRRSIDREVERNSVHASYDPHKAKAKARLRRRYSKYQGMKVRQRPDLQDFIVRRLKKGWTPEMIAGRLKHWQKKLPYISAKGIYKWLYSVHGQEYCPLLCSEQTKPRKHRKKTERSLIPHRVGIEKRPSKANKRLEYGHYETDAAVSGKRHDSTAALSVLHERKARYVRLRKIPNLKPATFATSLVHMANDLKRRTITYDNGIENRHHEYVAAALKVSTYFCHPYHSWEKGGVENTIGRIRRYIPKGANLADYSDRDITKIEHWLNHTPRKCLKFKTPYEIMTERHLLLSTSSTEPQWGI